VRKLDAEIKNPTFISSPLGEDNIAIAIHLLPSSGRIMVGILK
jgi:hypothetical protein